MKQKINLSLYTPHKAQLAFHESQARYRVFAAGRQVGKSSACLNELLKKAWENQGTSYWYLSPTYPQARIQYRRLVSMLWSCAGVILKNNQSELRIQLINQSEITFKSAEVFENLRGATLHGAVLDEVREMPPEIWNMIIQPMLATTNGWCVFASTPSGHDAFYDIAEKARTDTTGDWSFFQFSSTANPKFSQAEFERLKQEMSEPEFAQEILAEFRNIHAGKVYKSEGTHNHRMINPFVSYGTSTVCEYLPVVVGLDFNVRPMAWTLGQNRGQDWYFFDEIHVSDTNTEECSKELVQRILDLKTSGQLLANPNVILCGDATGESRNTKATQSDYAIICNAMKSAGITYENRTPRSNPPVKERVNAVNSRLKSADGSVHFWYHPIKCKHLKRDLERVSWKEGAQTMLDQTTDSSLTHASDSVGYPIVAMSPIEQSGAVGTIRIV